MRMALVDAAVEALRQADRALSWNELMKSILDLGLWSSPRGGKTPVQTLRERIATNIKGGRSPFVKNKEGKISLHPKWGERKRLTPVEKRGYVYAIMNPRSFHEHGWVKIGHSGMDVGTRIFTLQQGVPFNYDVMLLMQTVAPQKVEEELHERFKDFKSGAQSDEFFVVDIRSVEEEMKRLAKTRTYRGAKVLSRANDEESIKNILKASRNDPTTRGQLA